MPDRRRKVEGPPVRERSGARQTVLPNIQLEDIREKKEAIKLELLRRGGLASLTFFMTAILGYPPLDEVHEEVASFLNSVHDTTHRGLLLLPRGHLKSTEATVSYSIWRLIHDPDLRILISNAVLENSKGFLREIKQHFERNELLRRLYGDFANQDDKWSESQIIVRKRKKVLKEPSIQVTSTDKSVVSQHYDLIIGDDIVNRETVNTKEQRFKSVTYYRDLLDLLEPGGDLFFIGTRWHFNDLYGHIIDENEKEKTFLIMKRTVWKDEERREPLFRKFTPDYIDSLRAEKGAYDFSCTPSETPILMADFTTKPISEVRPGDKVIGFTTRTGKKHRLVETTVTEINSRLADVQTVTLASGRTVKCTADHHWFTNRDDKSHKPYRPAKVGGKLMRVADVADERLTDEQQRLAAWLGGIFDGEGRCYEGAVFIAQSKSHNPLVCKAIEDALTALGFVYGRTENSNSYYISGWEQTRRFMLLCKPVKSAGFVHSLLSNGGRFVREEDRVVSIVPEHHRPVHALVTGTGNYIAWGYASKNCQYLNSPIDEETADFSRSWINRFDLADLREKPHQIFITVDPAITKGELSDNTGIVVNAVTRDDKWYVIKGYRMKLNPTELLDELFSLRRIYGNRIKGFGIEAGMFQEALAPAMAEWEKKMGRKLFIEPIKHNRRRKEERIRGLIPRMERGEVFLSDYCDDLIEEMLAFPRSNTDDILDALAYQLDFAHSVGIPELGQTKEMLMRPIKPRFPSNV